MISAFINEVTNFLHSAFDLVLIFVFLRFVLRFGFRIKFPRFTIPKLRVNSRVSGKTHSKEWYDLEKFKYEAKLRYRLAKYEIKLKAKADCKKPSYFASISDYLKVVK